MSSQREAILRLASPLQSISERVFIADLSAVDVTRLQRTFGVQLVLVGDQTSVKPPDDLSQLNQSERLFVQGWMTSQKPKHRVAEGVPWDTPPMLPPDANSGHG